MIGKNEQLEDDNTNDSHVNFISETRKTLQDSSSKVKEEVRLCFEQLAKVLRTREKQLLRQIEAIHNQQLSIVQSNLKIPYSLPLIRIDLTDTQDLEASILKFGELSSSNRNGIDVRDVEPYKIEDYEDANRDHVTLDKSIKSEQRNEQLVDETDKFDVLSESACDLSFNTSSEADLSKNEITVLMNHNYSASSDGLEDHSNSSKSTMTESRHDDSKSEDVGENKLLKSSLEWELKVMAQPIRMNNDFIVPESEKIATPDKYVSPTKEAYKISSPNRDKNLSVSTDSGSPVENSEVNGDILMISRKTQDPEKHPKQIQQWLQQILVETETEPTIHEIEQFAEISKSRFKEFQFPLET